MPIKVKCDYCGKLINKSPSQINRTEHHFCSKKCYNIYERNRVEVKCDNCGEITYQYPSTIKKNKHHFCSYRCASEYKKNRVRATCDYCKKNIKIIPSKYKRYKHHFCSKKCYNKYKEKKTKIRCNQCGKIFERCPSVICKTNFCSKNCRQLWRTKCKSVKCKTCGKTIMKYLYELKKTKNYFCSRICASKGKNTRIEKKCEICNKTFKVSRYREKSAKYCSQKCYLESMKKNNKNTYCEYCGKKIIRRINDFNRNTHNFCSRECYSSWLSEYQILENSPRWNGGKSFEPYGPEFNRTLKEKIRKRDGYICQICGTRQSDLNRKLAIHHIDKNKQNNFFRNLISLCDSCHIKLHNGKVALCQN